MFRSRRTAKALQQNAALFTSCSVLILISMTLAELSGCQNKITSSQLSDNTFWKISVIQIKTAGDALVIDSPAAIFELTPSGYLKSTLKNAGHPVTLDDPGKYSGQHLILAGHTVNDFSLDLAHATVTEATGKFGKLGKHIEVKGASPRTTVAETVSIEIYDDFPDVALLSASFHNAGSQDIRLDSVSLQEHVLNARSSDPHAAPYDMTAFFGSSLAWGKDEVFRVPAKFSQRNPFSLPIAVGDDLGGAGGGIPVIAFWVRDIGVALGHIESLPLVLAIPVQTLPDGRVSASVDIPANTLLKPGETYSSPRTFLTVYSGDYFQPLSKWSHLLDREGLPRPSFNREDYAVSWCSWGYRADITSKQMLDTIPKLKDLGIHWATLDDRWYNNYGDWLPRTDTFPGDSMRKMVETFHQQGIKVQLWWLPIGVEDGQYGDGGRKFIVSDVVEQHPEWLVLGQDGKPARMTRNLAALCPAVPEVQTYFRQLTRKFILDWDFDGHKLDNIFAVPQCFNPKHHHKSPNDSVYAMGEIYKIIFDTTRALKPDSVTQSCPCGTPPSLAWFRYMDQAVTADPISSAQVRRRIKMYKALLGPRAAVYGDHVELTRIIHPNTPQARQLGVDFASTLGAGGVPGTKFTLPEYSATSPYVFLSPEKDAYWKKWIALYNDKMLSQGDFLDLYTYGYDFPEAYVIEKDGKLYYSFFTSDESPSLPSSQNPSKIWQGEIELRGLRPGAYKVVDYVNNREFGTVRGPKAKLIVKFKDSLLLEATPVAPESAEPHK
jgi:alpha-galactosidase